MISKRAFWVVWLIATIVWLAVVSTRFELVKIGAIPAPHFFAAAIGVPAALWVVGRLILWVAQRFGLGKSDGPN